MTKAEQARILHWAGGEPRQVARTCRHFGISSTAFYRWKKRFDGLGEAGLVDRPRTPHRSLRATSAAVMSKILYLRQNYHFGADRIAAYLQRLHQAKIARSTVHRILVKHGMGPLPANQKYRPHRERWQRYQKARPGHRLQTDVKFLERIPGTAKRLYQFTAIIARTGHCRVRSGSNDSLQKLELMCHRGLETLHWGDGGDGWT